MALLVVSPFSGACLHRPRQRQSRMWRCNRVSFCVFRNGRKHRGVIQKAIRKLQAGPEWALIPQAVCFLKGSDSDWAGCQGSITSTHTQASTGVPGKYASALLPRQKVWTPQSSSAGTISPSSVFLHRAQMLLALRDQIVPIFFPMAATQKCFCCLEKAKYWKPFPVM